MTVGLTTTKSQVDEMAGTTARAWQTAAERTDEFKRWLDTQPDQALIELGYTANEVAVLKSAYGDLAQITRIFLGQEGLAAPKDFTVFARQLWGLGVTSTVT